jgi:hypothetical protein
MCEIQAQGEVLRDHVLVSGRAELHSEGGYYLE